MKIKLYYIHITFTDGTDDRFFTQALVSNTKKEIIDSSVRKAKELFSKKFYKKDIRVFNY